MKMFSKEEWMYLAAVYGIVSIVIDILELVTHVGVSLWVG